MLLHPEVPLSRLVHLSRVDVRTIEDRSAGALTLRYVGRKLRFFDRLFGFPDGTFFVVILNEVPLPESLVTLASTVGVDLDSIKATTELRRAVADVLLSEATMEAPEYLGMCAEPRTTWLEVDARELEHRNLAAENKVRDLTKLVETALRRRAPVAAPAAPQVRTYAPMAPAGYLGRLPARTTTILPPPPVEEEVEEVEEFDSPTETSDATGKRVMAAVKLAREQELPQRLPGGARKALGRLPAGLYLAHGASLVRRADICSAMVDGAEGGKRGGEAAIIDWDGEWPVVARRYGSHGRIVYRVEEALRRHGVAMGEAA
jgi:hypothetical protein